MTLTLFSGLVDAGLIDLKPLVTHRFTLEDAVEAFETAVDISRGGTSNFASPLRHTRLTCSRYSYQVPNPRRRALRSFFSCMGQL